MIKLQIYSHPKNISSNHFFGDFFNKNVASFTKFLPKERESKLPKSPHCEVDESHETQCEKMKNSVSPIRQILTLQ